MRSLLILRKRDASDSKPTLIFEPSPQSYKTITYHIWKFLPRAEVSGDEHLQITLRFNAEKGPLGLSRSSTNVEELYRERSLKQL